VVIEYPLGHRFRREEAIPKIIEKFSANLAEHYSEKQRNEIEAACHLENLAQMSVHTFMELFVI
ncbi:MAG TPA: 2-methylcitrate dehydratase, partial [Candidatus Sphingobacterium stercoripullorum]|nr:2-methylcitrate dehydratase [Candidatus Sphingobacterium stercoripullorum]